MGKKRMKWSGIGWNIPLLTLIFFPSDLGGIAFLLHSIIKYPNNGMKYYFTPLVLKYPNICSDIVKLMEWNRAEQDAMEWNGINMSFRCLDTS